MYFPFRYSKNIEKQILWYFFTLFFLNKRFSNVLDVGCGTGKNIKFLKFEKYLGIDIDSSRIENNKKFLKSQKISFQRHDILSSNLENKESFSLILFIQVLTNNLFQKRDIEIALKNLMQICGGFFIFNTSSKNKNQIKSINLFLENNNIKFKTIFYGVPMPIRKIRIPIISQIIGLFYLILILINPKILSNEKIIYICKIN